jgi:hypothetical protein
MKKGQMLFFLNDNNDSYKLRKNDKKKISEVMRS